MPSPSLAVPTSTYRLQLHAGFTFDDAAQLVPYLADLGVTHVFCSPILQAVPGSTHGYDVVDHSRVADDLGGEDAFRRLAARAREHGLGLIVDIVPNHMAIPTPLFLNHPLWEALRDGPGSPFARWFDVDATDPRGFLLPVLGRPLDEELTDGTIAVESREIPGPGGPTTQPVVVHHHHVFPVRQGTEELPIAELLDAQHYRLAHSAAAAQELNYRRFFDVTTLIGVRVEDAAVFDATHATLLRLHAEGLIDGFRIDHPDGLANPRSYLAQLHAATGGAWLVAEKILESDEALPSSFDCAGTTGYDALLRVAGLFQDPAGLGQLDTVWAHLTGSHEDFDAILAACKSQILRDLLPAEIGRLTRLALAICDADTRLRHHQRDPLHRAISALLAGMDRYRAYVEPGRAADPSERAVLAAAAQRAGRTLAPADHRTLDLVVALASGDPGTGVDGEGAETLPSPGQVGLELAGATPDARDLRAEFMVRFAQTCGPAMAKAKEDTAFYRWNRFVAVNEVGSEPTVVGISPDEFHAFCDDLVRSWPASLTTLSTHDTKRSEDVRARLTALLDHPAAWQGCLTGLREATSSVRGPLVDGAAELLLWQTLVGTWRLPGTAAGATPIPEDRLLAYLTKAMREAKDQTSWGAPDEPYEAAVHELARFALTDPACAAALDAFTAAASASVRAAILGQKLVQLTMPGVADVYQGCELVDLSLVDPDNRRPVDVDLRTRLLAADGEPAGSLDAEKLRVTATALRLRREHPDAFRGKGASYQPLASTTGHAVAFSRGGPDDDRPTSITVATRLAGALDRRGGWGDDVVALPPGRFRDLLTGREVDGGTLRLADLLTVLPVALLAPIAGR